VKLFFRVAIGFLVTDVVAGVIAWATALILIPSQSCDGDFGCIFADVFRLLVAFAVFILVALGSAAVLSVAACQLARPGRRVLAGVIHLPLLVGALLLTAYLSQDVTTAVFVGPIIAASATAAIVTGQRRKAFCQPPDSPVITTRCM
jgi:dihydroxyacetone kinase DhaKLM complex PTS-EIIA-like component DhaM